MGYDLGVDLGGATVVAAVLREGMRRAEPVPLGRDGLTVPATAHRGGDGAVRTGEDAEARAATEPDRVVRDVTARLGDEVPLVVGGEPWRADDVAAEIVLAAVRRVAAREGGAARALAVTHPAGWGPHRERTLRRALVRVGLGHATLIAESRAAALAGARGSVAGVYDLGGRSFRAAVVRRGPSGTTEIVADSGAPARAGGTDIDAAVLALVRDQLGDEIESAVEDLPDDEARVALGALLASAHAAKEQLSAETEARVEVALGAVQTTVRITRAELEARITPLVAATVESFAGTVDAAGVPLDDVVLVGGSSRIPLVARLLAEELGRPVHPHTDPATVVAQGAALAAAEHAAARHREAMRGAPGPATGGFAIPGPATGGFAPPAPATAGVAAGKPATGGFARPTTGGVPIAAAGAAVMAGAAVGTSAAGARHRSSVTADAAAARAGAAASATGTWSWEDVDRPSPGEPLTAASGRSATAVLERTRTATDDVPRPPITTADAPIGPNADPGPLRRYRSWIVAGLAVVVLGAGAATVPIPGLTSARTTDTPAPTTTPAAPSVPPTPAPAASPAPAPPSSAAAPTTTADRGSSSGSSSGSGSSDSSGNGSGDSSANGSTRRSSAARPSAGRTRSSPAAFAPASPGTTAAPAAPVADPPSSAAATPPSGDAPAVVEPAVEPASATGPSPASGAGS